MAYRTPTNVLSVDTNAKTVKGQKYNFLTGILYLAPADISGINLCAMAELAGCKSACLYSAGRGAFNSVQSARVNKTRYFLENRADFMRHVARDIAKLAKTAAARGFSPLVRLNGTSDIRFESIPVDIDTSTARKIQRAPGQYANIFAVFPEVQFYDYSKLPNRRDIPTNYDLTFSYSGLPGFAPYVARAIAAGYRVAVVFRDRASIPAEFLGMECVDGDNSDIRHLDPAGVIVALYAKGAAKRDQSGFVVDARRVIPIAQA
jgi:hypothetical protein